jgi:hypothetical protein
MQTEAIVKRGKKHGGHRCVNCGMASKTARRVIDSSAISSELVYVCRAERACRKRCESRGDVFTYYALNPAKKKRRAA